MVMASSIPFVRKHMISVLASDTVSPNAAHTTTIAPIIFLSCLGKRETTPASSAYNMPYSDFTRAVSPSVAPACSPALVLFLMFLFLLFVSHLRPMGPNVLGYQSHLLQRCPPPCGNKEYSHLHPVLAFRFLSRCKFSTLTTRQPTGQILLTHVLTCSARENGIEILLGQESDSRLPH